MDCITSPVTERCSKATLLLGVRKRADHQRGFVQSSASFEVMLQQFFGDAAIHDDSLRFA